MVIIVSDDVLPHGAQHGEQLGGLDPPNKIIPDGF
jgi:hypothetical protein